MLLLLLIVWPVTSVTQAQLYDLGDPWHTCGDGNPLQPGVSPPTTK